MIILRNDPYHIDFFSMNEMDEILKDLTEDHGTIC